MPASWSKIHGNWLQGNTGYLLYYFLHINLQPSELKLKTSGAKAAEITAAVARRLAIGLHSAGDMPGCFHSVLISHSQTSQLCSGLWGEIGLLCIHSPAVFVIKIREITEDVGGSYISGLKERP